MRLGVRETRERMTVAAARANRLRVVCRYQPIQLRTSYSSSPQSPLANSKHSLDRPTQAGDADEIGKRCVGRAATGEEGVVARIGYAATNQKPTGIPLGSGALIGVWAQSYSRGPFDPVPQLNRCHAVAGTSASNAFNLVTLLPTPVAT